MAIRSLCWYRPDEHQLWALDFYASRFDGGDPGRLTFQQFPRDPNFSPTPYNNNWVDRYTVVLRHEHELGDGWLLQAKAWFTHQELDSRSAANLSPSGVPPDFTTVQDEGFNNGGLDVRFRKLWGDGTIFKGSALTFGGVVYHGDAPFTRFRNPDLFASRDSTEGVQTLDQDRTSDYQAVFAETLFRLGKFHIVPSFRLDHETVDVDTIIGPGATPGDPFNGHADRWVPLWGIGLGNDFGDRNEAYFSASSGWRPVRFSTLHPRFKFSRRVTSRIRLSPSISSSVCTGHPSKVFGTTSVCSGWSSIIAPRLASSAPLILIIVNTGSTRHRGLEGELSYDFLARFQHPPLVTTQPEPGKDVKDAKVGAVPGVPNRRLSSAAAHCLQ